MPEALMPRKREILLVDDSPLDRELARRALEASSLDIAMSAVSGGAEALEFLRRRAESEAVQNPLLVLLDLNMPGWDGEQTVSRIRDTDHIFMTPILMLTTSASERDIERMLRAGANGYFCKPVEFTEFINLFHTLDRLWTKYVAEPHSTWPRGDEGGAQGVDALKS